MQQHIEQQWEQLPAEEFAALGLHDLAYIKPIQLESGRTGYAIYSADGHEVAVVAGRDLAFTTVRQNEMDPVSLH